MKSLYKMLLTIAIGSAVFIGGFFYYHYDTPALQQDNTPTSDIITSSSVPEGFVVTQLDNGDRNIASPDGTYSITVSSSIYSLEDNGRLVLQDYPETDEAVGGPQGCINDIQITPDTIQKTVDSFVDYCKGDASCESSKVEDVRVGNLVWKKIVFSGGFVGSGWPSFVVKTSGGSVVVNFSCSDISYHEKILSQFDIK